MLFCSEGIFTIHVKTLFLSISLIRLCVSLTVQMVSLIRLCVSFPSTHVSFLNKIIFGIKILNYLLENKNQNNFELIFNLLKAQIHNYSNLNKKLIDMNQILNEIILDTKNNKKEIEKIINVKFKEENEDEEEIKSKHYKKLENNLIQCNYCNQKPYDVNKTKAYIIKHLLDKHNTIITVDDF